MRLRTLSGLLALLVSCGDPTPGGGRATVAKPPPAPVAPVAEGVRWIGGKPPVVTAEEVTVALAGIPEPEPLPWKAPVDRRTGKPINQDGVERVFYILRWFARHQGPDGRWEVAAYPERCPLEGPKCEPGQPGELLDGAEADLHFTATALLCLLGAGYDHKVPNQFQRRMQRALDWLVALDPTEVRSVEALAWGTMALGEAYAMTLDKGLRMPCLRWHETLLARRVWRKDAAGRRMIGWNRTGEPDWLEVRPTALAAMALKSLKAAGVIDDADLVALRDTVAALFDVVNEGREGIGVLPDRVRLDGWAAAGCQEAAWAAMLAVLVHVKDGRRDIMEQLSLRALDAWVRAMKADRVCFDRLYPTVFSTFQLGGPNWLSFCPKARRWLHERMRARWEGCFLGSFDPGHPDGAVALAGQDGPQGRPGATVFGCLALEVWYRYLPVDVKE